MPSMSRGCSVNVWAWLLAKERVVQVDRGERHSRVTGLLSDASKGVTRRICQGRFGLKLGGFSVCVCA